MRSGSVSAIHLGGFVLDFAKVDSFPGVPSTAHNQAL